MVRIENALVSVILSQKKMLVKKKIKKKTIVCFLSKWKLKMYIKMIC